MMHHLVQDDTAPIKAINSCSLGTATFACAPLWIAAAELELLLGKVNVPDEPITRVSEGFRITTVPDRVIPSVPGAIVAPVVGDSDEVDVAILPPITDIPDCTEPMDALEFAAPGLPAEEVVLIIEETVGDLPAEVGIDGVGEAALLLSTTLPDNVKLPSVA